jgi:DNA polymerase-3 subunit epsilon
VSNALPTGIRRSLDRLRTSNVPVAVSEVARQLLALDRPVAAPLARRIVGAALGHSPEGLPETLDAAHLRPAEETAVAEVPLALAEFAVVDLETTGLSPQGDSVIEIGAVRVARLQAVESFETLVRPPGPGPLSRAITDLTGIDDAMLAEAPPAHRALAEFRSWLDRVPHAPFVAHNAAFDVRFTSRALEIHGLRPLGVPVLCTQKLSRRLLPRIGRYNLDHLCAHFGISNRARHRALGDAEVTARALIELLRGALDEGEIRTLGDLLDLQARPVRRRRARRR